VKVVYSARYHLDIGPHVFPTKKYSLVHDRLIASGAIDPADVVDPAPASWDELSRVHTAAYLSKMRDGTMSSEDVAQLELPWSPELVEGFRVMVGGTMEGARLATRHDDRPSGRQHAPSGDVAADPVSSASNMVCHIGGGLHHAFPNHGEGFCPFNDVAVAVRDLQARGLERAAIIDLDVHHGNGTAFIFESDPRVFTFSIHQQHNYPLWKPKSSFDVGLPDGAGDARYLRELEGALPVVMAADPQCVFYLAGADPFEDDQLGGLRLTREGLRQRDRMVIEKMQAADVPLVITLAGGYARHVDDTVAIHAATIEEAKRATTRVDRAK
jgi:acetoin utilization deacetylase AcuC-like enzyme